MEMAFFRFSLYAYYIGAAMYLGYLWSKSEKLAQTGYGLIAAGVASHIISLIIRTYVARQIPQHGWYVPWSNWFESFSFFALVILAEYLIIQKVFDVPIMGAFVTPLACVAMAVAVHSPFGRQIPSLPPALQSYWMAIHVPVMFISYSAFANAFGIGIAYLIQEMQIKSKKPSDLSFRLPSLQDLDHLIYQIIWLAFPLLTLGVLLGARWAYDAWGRYWGWDPKETWALITWLVYLAYLHMRLVVGWRGRKTAYLSLLGFMVVIFTYYGVNKLSALHGFLSGAGR